MKAFAVSIIAFFAIFRNTFRETLPYVALKATPMVLLCYFVYSNSSNENTDKTYSKRILKGLIFSLMGDILLVYQGNELSFLIGMASFGVAHIFYMSAFGFKPLKLHLSLVPYIPGFILLVVYYKYITDPVLKLAVPIYITLIFTVTWRALARPSYSENIFNSKLYGFIGMVFFLVSDLVLSYNLFFEKGIVERAFVIMSTYYAAQYCLAKSVIDSKLKKNN